MKDRRHDRKTIRRMRVDKLIKDIADAELRKEVKEAQLKKTGEHKGSMSK